MYQQIKEMADKALELQNKNYMEDTLKQIITLCKAAEVDEKDIPRCLHEELDRRNALSMEAIHDRVCVEHADIEGQPTDSVSLVSAPSRFASAIEFISGSKKPPSKKGGAK